MNAIEKAALAAAKAFMLASMCEEELANSTLGAALQSSYPESTLLCELLDAAYVDEGPGEDGKVEFTIQGKECSVTVALDGTKVLVQTPDTHWSHCGPSPVLN